MADDVKAVGDEEGHGLNVTRHGLHAEEPDPQLPGLRNGPGNQSPPNTAGSVPISDNHRLHFSSITAADDTDQADDGSIDLADP